MPKNVQIKLQELQYKKSSANSENFGGFKCTLSNGVSKNFTASAQDTSGMTSFAIPDYSLVKRIKGCQLDVADYLKKLSFSKKDGNQITKV
jgi:hypothetical protein